MAPVALDRLQHVRLDLLDGVGQQLGQHADAAEGERDQAGNCAQAEDGDQQQHLHNFRQAALERDKGAHDLAHRRGAMFEDAASAQGRDKHMPMMVAISAITAVTPIGWIISAKPLHSGGKNIPISEMPLRDSGHKRRHIDIAAPCRQRRSGQPDADDCHLLPALSRNAALPFEEGQFQVSGD